MRYSTVKDEIVRYGAALRSILPVGILLPLLLLCGVDASAQGKEGAPPTWDLRYDLEQGESVTYRVISFDSIVVWTERPQVLLRQRAERITYHCDTVLPDGYGMRVTLDDVVIRERFDTLPWVTRDVHPWTGTSIYFLMDAQGQRIRLRDTLDAPGTMPGAPFQPLLIPHLGPHDTLSAGAGSVFDREMWLLENAYPPVEFTGGVLRKILGAADTLGHRTAKVQLNETGQLWFIPPAGPDGRQMRMHARVNGTGNYFIDFDYGFPVAGDYQMITNFTLTDQDGKNERFGRQRISMIFHVDELMEDLEVLMEREGMK